MMRQDVKDSFNLVSVSLSEIKREVRAWAEMSGRIVRPVQLNGQHYYWLFMKFM